MLKSVTIIVLLGAGLVMAAKLPPCKKMPGKILSCLRGTMEDLPTTNEPAIEWISFMKSNLPVITNNRLKNFPNLKDFHAEGNEIATLEPAAFAGLPLLDWVDLSTNKLTTIDANIFRHNPVINHLNVSGNQLVIPKDQQFLTSEKLRWLDMKNCHIKTLYKETFVGLPGLQTLQLSNNELQQLPNGVFEKQKKLVTLYLHNNKMKSLSMEVVGELKPLVLYMEGNPWQCDCSLYPVIQWTRRNLLKDDTKCSSPATMSDKKWKEVTEMKCLESALAA